MKVLVAAVWRLAHLERTWARQIEIGCRPAAAFMRFVRKRLIRAVGEDAMRLTVGDWAAVRRREVASVAVAPPAGWLGQGLS